MKPLRPILAGTLVLVLLASYLLYAQFSRDRPGEQRRGPPPAVVAAAPAQRVDWASQLTAVGTLQAVRGVDITAEISGKVTRIAFEAGGAVAKGDLLVELDAAAEEAALRSLRARLENARRDETRARRLIETGVIARADLEEIVTNRRDLEAQVEEQRAEVGKKTIRAPFAGRVGVRQISPGELIEPGTLIVTLQSVAPIYVNFPVPEREIASVHPGQRVQLTVPAYPGRSFEGEVGAVNPKAAAATRDFTVQALLANDEGLLRPGMFADVVLRTGESRSVVAVPATAVAFNAYGESVFKVAEPGDGAPAGPAQQEVRIARRVFVETGDRRGLLIEIVRGVEAGEQVVTAGQIKIDDGYPIIISPEDAVAGIDPVPAEP